MNLNSTTCLLRAFFLAVAVVVPFGGGAMAQANLVPNGSFEEYNHCSTFLNPGWPDAWFIPEQGYTPDYFNGCAIYVGLSVPENSGGFQHPLDGVGYCGIYSLDLNHPNDREAITVQLSSELVAGEKYVFSAYFSLGEKSNYSVGHLGALLTETSISGTTPIHAYSPTVFYHSGNLSDKLNWTHFSDTLTAIGNENFLTIANFFDDGQSDTVYVGGGSSNGPIAYYYIDDVSLIPLDTLLSAPTLQSLNLKIFPNPASGQVSIELNRSSARSSVGMKLRVVDVVGRNVTEKVLTSPNPSLQGGELLRIDVGDWPDGVYVLILTDGDGNRYTQRLVVQH